MNTKVSAINSYNYKTHSLKQPSEPSFEGKLQLKETANKAITKKNIFNFALLSYLITKLLSFSEIDTPELINDLPLYILCWTCFRVLSIGPAYYILARP